MLVWVSEYIVDINLNREQKYRLKCFSINLFKGDGQI